jgi:hypothetical protein
MTQNTVNYGFRIPNADGSDNIVPDDLRLPITAIDTKIKDRANEIAATNTTVAGHTTTLNALGTWVTYAAELRTDVGAAAAAGTTIVASRYMKIGKTVTAYVEASCTALVANASLMLPAAAGTPNRRFLACGVFQIINSGAPITGQMGVARMTTGLDRCLAITNTGAFCDAPAGSNLQMLVTYEVN